MKKYLRFILAWILIFLPQSVLGQKEALNQFWNEYAFTHNISENWVAELDGGLTSSGVPDDNNIFYGITQFSIRGWIHYYPADRWKLSFFYSYYYNKNVPELNQNKAPEYRLAVQATYNLFKQHRFNINLRVRFEDRNIENEQGIFEAVERFRFQGRAVYPINHVKIEKKTLYAFVSDELYFKTKSEISGSEFFDRNRATIGLGYKLSKDLQVEISYANEYLPRTSADKIYNALQINVTFENIFYDASKKVVRKEAAVDDGAPSGGGG